MGNLLIIILCLLLSLPSFCQTNTLPKPSGKYFTGITYLHFTDNSRRELFDNSKESNREITVKVWYPTDTLSTREHYLLDAEFAIKYCMFPEKIKNLTTNSSRDLTVSSQKQEYPVLLFSHGWGEHFSQNSILMEELASHGYIIFSIAHHFECKYSEYPDGRIFHLDMTSNRFQKIWQELNNPKAMELIYKMYNANNDEERIQVYWETSNILPTLCKESPKYWAEDISFFLDQLKDINTGNKIFKDKLNLEKIGVFGMSMGGIASGEICITDKRVKACINIDGGFFPSALDSTIRTPFLFLNSKRFLGYGKLFTGNSTTDCYSLSVNNSDHYNFTDYSLYQYSQIAPLLGTIDGARIIKIMNVTILAFFDKYLKEEQNIDLKKFAEEYSEIKIVTNIEL